MFYYDFSIERELARQTRFSPPYCPNPDCVQHMESLEDGFTLHGWLTMKRFPHKNRRYKCKFCDQTVSYYFYTLEYRQVKYGLNREIFTLTHGGTSNRQIGRYFDVSEHLVRARIEKISRWGMLRHMKFMNEFKITEPIVYDGLENFAFSQYDPNNLNHAIGKQSQFIYYYNLAPMNRKGRMSDRQKAMKEYLERKFGAYPKYAIRNCTTELLKWLCEHVRKEDSLILHSDEHYQYRKSIKYDVPDLDITHITTSAKEPRTHRNKLFAVNFADMLIRHMSAAYKRETIAFSKNHNAMVDRYTLFMINKNYMRTRHIKPHVLDERANKESPAMTIGLTDRIMKFREFFKCRIMLTQIKLSKAWRNFYRRVNEYPRMNVAAYSGI